MKYGAPGVRPATVALVTSCPETWLTVCCTLKFRANGPPKLGAAGPGACAGAIGSGPVSPPDPAGIAPSPGRTAGAGGPLIEGLGAGGIEGRLTGGASRLGGDANAGTLKTVTC